MGKQVKLLFAEADREKLAPILDALKAKGISASEGKAAKGDTVLAVLSENFYADSALGDALLSAVGSGAENVLPLQLDSAGIPDDLKNALFARNIISVGERDAGLVADRIADALSAKKSRIPGVFLVGGVALVALIGFLIARGMQSTAPESAEETAAVEAEEIEYPLPAGLTKEELEQIRCVAVIGNQLKYYTYDQRQMEMSEAGGWANMLEQLGNADPEDRRWYWNENGSEITRAPYDLRFLSLMPNLEELQMAQVQVTEAPDLSGLTKFRAVRAYECDLGDITWIANSAVQNVYLRCDTEYDLLGKCGHLRYAYLETTGGNNVRFPSGSFPRLRDLELNASAGAGAVDLSGLAGCSMLGTVVITRLPLQDLSFIEGNRSIERLEIVDMDQLADISAVDSLPQLNSLRLDRCPGIRDYNPVAGCGLLKRLMINPERDGGLQDLSFLGGLKNMNSLHLIGVSTLNLGFLNQMAEGRERMEQLFIDGDVAEYSGLEAFKSYTTLSLSARGNSSTEEIAPYLEGINIGNLYLRGFSQIDLSHLPPPLMKFALEDCDITDLSTVTEDWKAPDLELSGCMMLSSLEGLEKQSGFGKQGGRITIVNCPRLVNWDAIAGTNLSSLDITGGFTLPSMGTFRTSALNLDSVADVSDLSFLDEMDSSQPCSFKLVGLEGLSNLKPLERFTGTTLTVSPELEEQARDLVQSGKFKEYKIEYPQGGWELDEPAFTLLSLDELETFPDAMLRRVGGVGLVRDTLFDPEKSDIWEDWDDDEQKFNIHYFDDDENVEPVGDGEGPVTEISFFEKLTGLKRLSLCDQPLESLDGIQNFRDLEFLTLNACAGLTDISPAFTLQNLRSLSVSNIPAQSIQGIQNLPGLWELDIRGTGVSDLTPLSECDFSAGIAECGGFILKMNGVQADDYSPLAAIPTYKRLEINDVDPAKYVPFLEGKKVFEYCAVNAFKEESSAEDVNALFAEYVQGHPETEVLQIPWNEGITDLTLILDMENLRYVRVSANMEFAIASLEGQDLQFELDIEGE